MQQFLHVIKHICEPQAVSPVPWRILWPRGIQCCCASSTTWTMGCTWAKLGTWDSGRFWIFLDISEPWQSWQSLINFYNRYLYRPTGSNWRAVSVQVSRCLSLLLFGTCFSKVREWSNEFTVQINSINSINSPFGSNIRVLSLTIPAVPACNVDGQDGLPWFFQSSWRAGAGPEASL